MNREKLVSTIKEILQSAGVKKAYLFGSFARDEKKYHDIDIAIKPPKEFSLLDLAHLENVLEGKTKKKIDLGTIDSIHPLVKQYARKDFVALL
ncbi:MAG: hypothetical protein A3K22_02310 [Deltaproteobacteria bacterium RBG_16_42_7]|nr:MAG: hypothetical protein A3K22_02310 [Deltaproteobacteria bacterium RBG_16_42_7]